MPLLLAPNLSEAQQHGAAKGAKVPAPKKCMVTGGTGFVGQRLVEMLVERGADRVVSFDIVPKSVPDVSDDTRVTTPPTHA
jgi:FlaA1/EpsC-like NDP-sugar epimerase